MNITRYLLPIIAPFLILSIGCQSLTYKESCLPRTPIALKNSIKHGSVKLTIDEPLHSENRSQGPSGLVGGANRISYPAGAYVQKIASAILADAASNGVASSGAHYVLRVKAMEFYYSFRGVKLTQLNANVFAHASITVNISTTDGKTISDQTYKGDESNYFDTLSVRENEYDSDMMNTALTGAIHNAICKAVTELKKYDQSISNH